MRPFTRFHGPSLLLPAVALAFRSAPNLSLISTDVLNYPFRTSAQLSNSSLPPPSSVRNPANTTTIDILFDTTNSTAGTADALAWTDSAEDTGSTLCMVCLEIGLLGDEARSGYIASLGYDYWHKLDPGLVQQVASFVTRPRDAGEQYFESSYIYGSSETRTLQHLQEIIPAASELLVLDIESSHSETMCVQTRFAVYNRVGVQGAKGEISRRSVFRLGVDFEWEGGE